jgi:hypothetical protein
MEQWIDRIDDTLRSGSSNYTMTGDFEVNGNALVVSRDMDIFKDIASLPYASKEGALYRLGSMGNDFNSRDISGLIPRMKYILVVSPQDAEISKTDEYGGEKTDPYKIVKIYALSGDARTILYSTNISYKDLGSTFDKWKINNFRCVQSGNVEQQEKSCYYK